MTGVLAVAGALVVSLGAFAIETSATTGPQMAWHRAGNPDPFRGYVSDVDCVGPNWCMIVDHSGQAVRYHDGQWDRPVRIEAAAELAGLQAVSCASRRVCMAVDAEGRLTRYNGSSWSRPDFLGKGVLMQNVSCPSATFCMALGNRIARWNGSRWRLAPSPLPKHREWASLSCSSASFCMTTFRGPHNNINAWMYAHHRWSFSARLTRMFFDAVSLSCTSRSFCMAVGDLIYYERWDGTRWHTGRVETQSAAFDPQAVSCISPRRCVAVGTTLHPESAEWDGKTWGRARDFDSSPSQDLAAFSCVGTALRCLTVDQMGGVTWYTRHVWHRTVTRDPGWGTVEEISCGSTMCIAADLPGGYVRTSGAGWSRPRRSYPKANFSIRSESSLSCTSDTFCLQLANNGVARRYDGLGWHTVARAPITGAELSCVSARWCAALAPYTGQLAVYNGSSWRKRLRPLGSIGETWTLSCGSRTLCIASNSMGVARVFNGSGWGAAKTIGPKYQTWNAASCVSATFCMVGGAWGTTWRYDGTRWHKIAIDGAEDAISCTSATFCAGVGGAQVEVFDGRTWTVSTTLQDPDGLPYQEIGCASRRLCVVSSPANRVEVGTAS